MKTENTITRQGKVTEYDSFDCDTLVLLAIAEVAHEYIITQEVN